MIDVKFCEVYSFVPLDDNSEEESHYNLVALEFNLTSLVRHRDGALKTIIAIIDSKARERSLERGDGFTFTHLQDLWCKCWEITLRKGLGELYQRFKSKTCAP
jgi:hypothetical protein